MKQLIKRDITYNFLVLLRILLVFVPQTGYIHPDEIFQSVEVLAGKILDVQYSPPWEFNVTNPIRSMAIQSATIGLSYSFLRDFNNFLKHYLNQSLVTPYTLLIVPRLIMCALSFVVDYCLYKLCLNNNEKYKSRLIVLSTSYVMLVYGTRTFSNTVELILFSLLLFYVCESLTFNNILLRKKDYINFRYDQSKTTMDKAKFHKLKLYLVSDSYRNCHIISTVTVFGFFNRPTFLAFAIMPIFCWLYRGIGTKSVSPLTFYTRLLIFTFYSIPSFLINILVDSFYYGYVTWGEIGVLDVTLNNFVVTPLNFVMYNSRFDNLAVHGLHPRFLHVLVNIPLLFNVIGIYAMYVTGRYLYLCCLKKINLLPTVRSIKCLMTLSFLVPLAVLSVFPHQEPRFLIPLIVPLVYLHGTTLLPEYDSTLVENPKAPPVIQPKKAKVTQYMLKTWLLLNVLLTFLYGFLHQGGVFQATKYLSSQMQLVPSNTEYHVFTSHIYSIPESFFLQKSKYQLYLRGKINNTVSKRIFLYEEGSKGIPHILNKIKLLLDYQKQSSKQFKTYLLITGSLEDNLDYEFRKTNLKLYPLKKFYPHLSFEAFPDFSNYCLDFTKFLYNNHCVPLPLDQYFKWIYSLFGLNLYRIELKVEQL